MIGYLKGTLVEKHPPRLIVDVNGVGYEVDAPMSTFYVLPATGSQITIHTHLHVREDAQQLYGFASKTERTLFRDLIRISGVGAKLALSVLSGISAEDFVATVQTGDIATLTRLPGIGKKTAERLVIEMRDRFGDSELLPGNGGININASQDPAQEAFSALTALGYKPAEATRLIKSVNDDGLSSEELIRKSLQNAVQRNQ